MQCRKWHNLCDQPFPWDHHASLNAHNYVVHKLLQQLQVCLRKHSEKIFINHIRAYSGLPGMIAKGNKTDDCLARPIFKPPAEEHATLHTNACHLHVNNHISWRQARQIIDKCTICASLHKRAHVSRANSLGLQTNILWQVDFLWTLQMTAERAKALLAPYVTMFFRPVHYPIHKTIQ